MRRFLRFVPILGLVASLGVITALADQFTFDPGGLDDFETFGVFELNTLDGTVVSSEWIPVSDPNTIIGRSDSHVENDPEDANAEIVGWDPVLHEGTSQFAPDPCVFPPGFPEAPSATRKEVAIEILSMELTNAELGLTIRAGTKYWNSGNPAVTYFYQDSFGEVTSTETTDFPADSFFNVFVEVETPFGVPLDRLYNLTPMVVRAYRIYKFPPEVNLPTSTYIHDPTFPAVPLYDDEGIHRAYLTSAGHGGPDTTTELPEVGKASMMIAPSGTVTFSVDNQSAGLTPAQSTPNHVRDDQGQPLQQRTTYQSPGEAHSNTRDLVFGGADGDTINSLSYGEDGTGANRGTLVFSVDRNSEGQICTDVRINWEQWPLLARQASPLYASGVSHQFGVASGEPVTRPPAGTHFMLLDPTANGLRPSIGSELQDDLTTLELSARAPNDLVYLTATGPNFAGAGDKATIYSWDPTSGQFEPGNLQVFATPAALGLDDADEIDALAVSAASDEVLFSLTRGSPTVSGGISAADVLYSNLGGSYSVFATADSLGLLDGDNLDAADILRSIPGGGIAEPIVEGSASAADASAPGSARDYTVPIAAAAAVAGVLALAAGGWYVRRRLS